MKEKENNNIGTQYVSCSYAIIKLYGLDASAIFGYVWSKQNLKKGYCYVKLQTMADDLCLNRKTVSKKLQMLKRQGLIKNVGG